MKKTFILSLEDDAKSRELLSELLMRGFAVRPYIAPSPTGRLGTPEPAFQQLKTGDKVLMTKQADPDQNGMRIIGESASVLPPKTPVQQSKVKLVNGLGIYENFVKWVGDRSSFTEASMKMWFHGLQESTPEGIRRFNPHSLSTLKHELRKSGLMVCHDGKCLVDPETLRSTTGQQMREIVEQARRAS